MIKLLIFLTFYTYNYQVFSNISLMFSQFFYETLSPVPQHANTTWLDLNSNYILAAPAKQIAIKDSISAGISIIVKKGDSTLYPGKLWNGLFAADYNTLYLRYRGTYLDFIMGRVPIKWSNSPLSSMIFTGYEPGMDLVYYRLGSDRLSIDYFFSILYDNEPMRYLVAHRILARPIKDIQVAFKDIILYKTSTNIPDMYYFNPFAIYYLRQWELDSSGFTNSIFDFSGELLVGNFHLYGELMIDDFPYIKVYHENPRMGVLGGIVWNNKDFSTLLEYVRINRFTYCYYTFAPYMGFKYLNIPLGHPEGNDFDKITLMAIKRFKWGKAGIKVSYLRHGEGTLDETYRSTSEESEHYFLSGIVEKRFIFVPLITVKLHTITLYISPVLEHIRNYRHTTNYNTTLISAKTSLNLGL